MRSEEVIIITVAAGSLEVIMFPVVVVSVEVVVVAMVVGTVEMMVTVWQKVQLKWSQFLSWWTLWK